MESKHIYFLFLNKKYMMVMLLSSLIMVNCINIYLYLKAHESFMIIKFSYSNNSFYTIAKSLLNYVLLPCCNSSKSTVLNSSRTILNVVFFLISLLQH